MLSVSHSSCRGMVPKQMLHKWQRRGPGSAAVAVAVVCLLLVAELVKSCSGAFAGITAGITTPRLHGLVAARASSSGTPVAELEVGQVFKVKATNFRKWKQDAFFVNVGAEVDGYLSVGEIRDGFPTEELWDKLKSSTAEGEFEVKVLEKTGDGQFFLTMRSGSLTRPPTMAKHGSKDWSDLADFQDIGPETWLEGEVGKVTVPGVSVWLAPPAGGERISQYLSKADFMESFFNECIRGGKVRVRIRGIIEVRNKKLLDITMKDP